MDNRLKFIKMDLGSRTPIPPERHYGVYFYRFRTIKIEMNGLHKLVFLNIHSFFRR
jgi:hypothetical protein